MVSLDGVIEHDEPSSGSALTNATHSRKRKLLKPFKPPTRIAPPLAPADDAWGPPGRDQRQRRAQFPEQGPGAMYEGQRALPQRSSYAGFGQVASLSDDDEEEDEGAGLGLEPRGAGWGNGVAEEYRRGHGDRHDGRMGSNAQARFEVVPAMQSSSVAATARTNEYTWEREDWRATDGTGHSSRGVNRGEMPSPRSQNLMFGSNAAEGPVHGDDDRRTGDAYLEKCQNDWGGGAWPQSARDGMPGQQSRAYGEAAAMDQRQQLDQHNGNTRGDDGVEDEHLGSAFGSERISGNLAPKSCPEHSSRLRGQEQMRSTQDIMSLFGGFGRDTPAPSVNEGVHNATPRQTQQQVPIPLGPRERNEVSPVKCSRNQGGQEGLQPESYSVAPVPGGGEDRAAELRRAQKAANVAEEGSRVCEAFVVGGMDSAHTVDEPAGDVATDWVCDVCGVRGSPPLNVCRVCGNSRQVPEIAGSEDNSDPQGLLPGGDTDDRGGAGGVDDIGVGLEIVDRDEDGHDNAVRARQQGIAEGNQWRDKDRGGDGGSGVGDEFGVASGTGRSGITHLGRFMDAPFDEYSAGTTPQEERGTYLHGTGSSPNSRSLSQVRTEGCKSASACGGSTPQAGSNRRKLSVRMLMDLGSSSASDSD